MSRLTDIEVREGPSRKGPGERVVHIRDRTAFDLLPCRELDARVERVLFGNDGPPAEAYSSTWEGIRAIFWRLRPLGFSACLNQHPKAAPEAHVYYHDYSILVIRGSNEEGDAPLARAFAIAALIAVSARG